MRKTSIWLWFGLSFAICAMNLCAETQKRCPILFAVYDMGDMNALKVVSDVLAARKEKVCFFALGQANTHLKDDPRVVFHGIGAGGSDVWPRERLLTQDILVRLKEELQPDVIVTGMASAAQNQMLSLVPDRAFAFYDNFDPIKGKEYVQTFLAQGQRSGIKPAAYWVASKKTAESFRAEDRAKNVTVEVVGQPVLEEWEVLFKQTDKKALRHSLGIPEDRHVILFAGGYDESYEEHFRLFLKTVVPLIDILRLEVLITYHPKPKGALEKKLVRELGHPHVRVIDTPPIGVATNKLATIASLFMCHKSSLGPQAISQGLPMIYVANPKTYRNFVIDEKLAHIADQKDILAKLIKTLLEQKEEVSLAPLGVPGERASALMAQKIAALRASL